MSNVSGSHHLDGSIFPAAPQPQGLAAAIDRISGGLCFSAMVIASVCVAFIVIIGTVDTFGRALMNSPVMGAVELTESLLATTIFLALPYAQRHAQHVVVDIVIQSFSTRWQLIAFFCALVFTFLSFLLLAVEAVDGAHAAWLASEVSAGYVPVPIWLAKLLSAAGLIIAVFETARQIVWTILWPKDALSHRGAASAEAVHLEQD
jgi:TRAP-type transport system small permease protein